MDKDKKLKILQVHNYYQIPGGEDTVVANEKKLLEDHGYEVIQYSRNNSELKEFSKLRKLLLPFTTIFNPRTYKEIKQIIKEQNIDIVHVHNTLNLISPAVYYAALSCKVPVVQTVHNFRLLCPGATFYRNGHICEDCASKGLGCAVKHGCYRGSKVQTLVCAVNIWVHRLTGVYGKLNYICLTEFNKEKLLSLKQIKPEQVYIKPNFVASELPLISYEDRPNQYIFAGRLDKLKGIDLLFEAWKQMGDNVLKLIVCGTGPMEDWCKDFIAKNRLSNIEMRGFVPNNEVKKLIANSKALILPTQWYEGFPMTIVEAYSVGTPVIGSDLGNTGSVVEEGTTGAKFEYNSVNSLHAAVEKFEKSDDVAMGDNAYKKYINKFDEKSNYQILMSVYSEISGGGDSYKVAGLSKHFMQPVCEVAA